MRSKGPKKAVLMGRGGSAVVWIVEKKVDGVWKRDDGWILNEGPACPTRRAAAAWIVTLRERGEQGPFRAAKYVRST